MRTTIHLADDVAAAVEKARRERGIGLSEAVNDLVRAGLLPRDSRQPIDPPSYNMGAKVDLSNIGEVLEMLDAEDNWGLGDTGPGR
jgi:Arc/MetJ family transcription regulator